MLASIGIEAGEITVFGSANDDTFIISNVNDVSTDISVNAGTPNAIARRFSNHQIEKIVLYAGDGDDSVYSTSIIPTRLLGQNGNDLLYGGFAADEIFGQAGNDRIVGRAGNDDLNGGTGDDIIVGGSGDDTIYGAADADRLSGNDGDDLIHGDGGIDRINGGNGDDAIHGGAGIDILLGNTGDDEIFGGEGNDRIYGESGNDRLMGESGNDRLFAGDGDDYLDGGTQADSLWGNLGQDIFAADVLDSFVDLTSPIDRIEFSPDAASTYTHVYSDGSIDVYGTEDDDEIRFFEDRATINGVSTSLDVAQAPVVRVFARGGDDDVRQPQVIVGGPSYQLHGGAGDDYLRGGFNDILEGGAGDDRLVGRGTTRYLFSGDVDLGFDVLVQNIGTGSLDFSRLNWQTGIDLNLDDLSRQTVAQDIAGNRMLDLLLFSSQSNFQTNVEFVTGTDFDDTISGFFRSAEGLNGDDVFLPTSTSSTIIDLVGQGYDTLNLSNIAAGTTIDMSLLPDASIEKIIGTPFDDTLTNNRFTQVLEGGAGNDVYKFSPTPNDGQPIDSNSSAQDSSVEFHRPLAELIRIEEDPSGGIDTADYSDIQIGVDIDLRRFPEVENLIGTDFPDRLIGNQKDNQILGGRSYDFIEGREGTDDLQGQQGTDIYNVIPGEELEVTDVITDEGPSVTLPEVDNDGDGLLPSEEVEIGTDPNAFDSDGDLLGDGFENASDLLDPNALNDPKEDSDGDGLNDLNEQIYGTDPDLSDTDGDGTNDNDEIDQGGDPTDPSDEGEAPANEDIVELALTIGDHSGSHSERYDLSIGRIHHQAPDFGVVETNDYKFERGNVFDVRITHRGSNLSEPDYDYQANIQPGAEFEGLAILEDPEDIIRTDGTSHFFFAQGKTAKLYLPKVDLDILYPDGSTVDEEDETDAAKTGYLFPRIDADQGETELTPIRLEKVKAGISGTTRLLFNSNKLRVWKNRQRTEEVTSNGTEFEIDRVHNLFVESLTNGNGYNLEGSDVGFGNLQIRAVFTPKDLPEDTRVIGSSADDRIVLRAVKADLDIRLNDGQFLNETVEDNPGITIDLGADKNELAELKIFSLIPQALNYAMDFFTLDFDDTILKIWNHVPGEVGLDALEEVTANTVFDESESLHSVWVEGFVVGVTEISLVWHSSHFGDDTPVVFDSVKVTTEGFRDVDILLAVDGTGSRRWLDEPSDSPGGTGKTVFGNRWLSHTRNWVDGEIDHHYGDGEEDKFLPLDGPEADVLWGYGEGATGSDVPQIIQKGYEWVSEQYWAAIEKGAEPKVDLIGMSRGAMIASEIAWKIQREGFVGGNGLTSEHDLSVRFLGLYDPVDQAEGYVEETRSIASIVENAYVGVATNFAGNDPDEISRHYWDRIDYSGAVSRPFKATHSSFQGSPTYSTDAGSTFFTVAPGDQNHPIGWLEGYSDVQDVNASKQIDTWFRTQARSVFVPIELVDNYYLDVLHNDPNDESPNHDRGYGQ